MKKEDGIMSQNIISQMIYENRRRLKLSQKELGDRLGVSNRAVSKWERGYSYPDTSLLLPIAKKFDVTLDELFGRTDDRQINKQRPSGV